MLILKLNLPTAKVNYNYLGACTSDLVPYTPDKIAGIQMNIEVTGYLADDAFFAFKLTSPDRALSMSEQFTLLSKIGFKTIPVERYPTVDGAINSLIRTKSKFAKYGAYWWDQDAEVQYRVPDLTVIKDVAFTLDQNRRLVRVLNTEAGVFNVIDHRIPEYYQPGATVKVMDGTVQPFQSSPITEDIPFNCPICNNPLKKYQLANDLPLIYKCTSSFCLKLDTTSDPIPAPVVEDTPDDSFRQPVVEEVPEIQADENHVEELAEPVKEEPVVEPEEVVVNTVTTILEEQPAEESTTEVKPLVVVNLEVQVDSEEFADKVQFVTHGPADYVLKNGPRSSTKMSRKVAQEYKIPLITVNELKNLIQ